MSARFSWPRERTVASRCTPPSGFVVQPHGSMYPPTSVEK